MEGVNHLNIAHALSFLEVLREKVSAVACLGGRDDQSVPPGQMVTILDPPSAFNNSSVYGYRVPCKQEAHIFSCTLQVHAGLELVCHRYIELIQNLKLNRPAFSLHKTGHPCDGLLLLEGY